MAVGDIAIGGLADSGVLGLDREALAASDLAWTVAHFGSLADGPATGARVTTDLGRPRRYRISRADVAACLLTIAVEDALIHRRVVLDGVLVRGDGRLIVPAPPAADIGAQAAAHFAGLGADVVVVGRDRARTAAVADALATPSRKVGRYTADFAGDYEQ